MAWNRDRERPPFRPTAWVSMMILLAFCLPLPSKTWARVASVHTHHHMSRIAPRQDDSGGDGAPLVVTNNCADTVYPGIVTQSGDGPSQTGFELQPGDQNSQTVSIDWQGRVWGRTNCSFNSQGTGPSNGGYKACGTGDCNGIVNCRVTVRLHS